MKKPRNLPDSKGYTERVRRWRHYSFLGAAKNMQGQLENMLISDTITDDTRDLAEALLPQMLSLQKRLQQRKS